MIEFDIREEANNYVNELLNKERKVAKSKNFEVNYSRQYELEDYKYCMEIISQIGKDKIEG